MTEVANQTEFKVWNWKEDQPATAKEIENLQIVPVSEGFVIQYRDAGELLELKHSDFWIVCIFNIVDQEKA